MTIIKKQNYVMCNWHYKFLHSRNVGELLFVVPELDSIDVSSKGGCIVLGTLVVATQVLGKLLVVVEHNVCLAVPANHCVGPQLLHEEDLVCKVRRRPCAIRVI